jgi:hypothetical protein
MKARGVVKHNHLKSQLFLKQMCRIKSSMQYWNRTYYCRVSTVLEIYTIIIFYICVDFLYLNTESMTVKFVGKSIIIRGKKFFWRNSPYWVRASLFTRFVDHIQRRTTVGISSWQRPLFDSSQHLQQTDIHVPMGFEPTISAGERPQTHALDRATTGTGIYIYILNKL